MSRSNILDDAFTIFYYISHRDSAYSKEVQYLSTGNESITKYSSQWGLLRISHQFFHVRLLKRLIAAPGSFRNRVGADASGSGRPASSVQPSSKIPPHQPSDWSSVSWVKGPVLFKMRPKQHTNESTSMDWLKRTVTVTANPGCAVSPYKYYSSPWLNKVSFILQEGHSNSGWIWTIWIPIQISQACPGGNTPDQAWLGRRRLLGLQASKASKTSKTSKLTGIDLASVPYSFQLMAGQSKAWNIM